MKKFIIMIMTIITLMTLVGCNKEEPMETREETYTITIGEVLGDQETETYINREGIDTLAEWVKDGTITSDQFMEIVDGL